MKPRSRIAAVALPLLLCLACDRGTAGGGTAPSTAASAPTAAAGPGPSPASSPAGTPAAAAPDMAKGRNLYAVYCLRCHGPKGEGNGPMAAMLGNVGNLADPTISQRLPAEKMKELIKAGKNKMPAFGPVFSEDQINQVVAFALTLRR
jgi:mono/diheme cytochrome c family protein